MTYDICYGANSTLRLDLPSDRLVAACANGQGARLGDPAAATAAAVANPIGFPPLHRAVVPGDRVVIALAEGVPQAAAVVGGIVASLQDAHIDLDSILLLHANQAEQDRFEHSVGHRQPGMDVPTAVHEPDSETDLAYLAGTAEGHPVYLNRHLCDADIVIPIGLMRMASAFDYEGVYGGLFPTFSDQATQRRHRAPTNVTHAALGRRRQAEVDEVAWLLGVQLVVQIIPGPGDSILHVLAGLGDQLFAQGQQLSALAWSTCVPRRASLVVATIEGDAREQTWQNFSRALFAASQVCDEPGSIVLCTGLRQRVGPSLQRLFQHGPSSEVVRDIQRDRSRDAVPALLLVETCERQHVYLLSGLDEQMIEGMQLGYISSASDINRLIHRHESCIILPNAHRAVATIV